MKGSVNNACQAYPSNWGCYSIEACRLLLCLGSSELFDSGSIFLEGGGECSKIGMPRWEIAKGKLVQVRQLTVPVHVAVKCVSTYMLLMYQVWCTLSKQDWAGDLGTRLVVVVEWAVWQVRCSSPFTKSCPIIRSSMVTTLKLGPIILKINYASITGTSLPGKEAKDSLIIMRYYHIPLPLLEP